MSDLCDEYDLHPSRIYRWQKQLFENAAAAFRRTDKRAEDARGRKKLLYAIWKVRMTPRDIRETYRKRFGIETSYRRMNEARIETCRRDPRLRLLFVDIAMVLRNVWVWLHFKLAKNKSHQEPQLLLQLLRFREMLLWIAQVVGRLLGADQHQGIDRETYQRLTENT